MNEVRQTILTTSRLVVIVNALAIGVVTILFSRPMPYVLGIVFGSLIGMLNFYELAITLEKSVKMHPGKANRYATIKYMVRFLLTAVVLFIAIRSPQLHVLGAVFGLLSIKFVVYAMNLLNDKEFYKKIFVRKEE
ncbi:MULTISPECIES: ATP synthase subunit I [unclassified Fusibacter]|uniref:ATP synthase subunit I n=1 Tax=unclassified Fusibacter TaxID=2624464 RepID=UPI00101322FA|nr:MULTISPECIES: ATP synthase subunit I [unclassified Fusibacter]MCK8059866.1 ATP synthase subunit I [Fusibacter sp. A2]NPE21668.1 ATP synthase subunit I [Fusibacter sp. A1]RXV62072.1 ATP synthase subunit I [Fusibacter sp. A1]